MRKNRFVPAIEQLESRLVPYALSGVKWAVLDVSASFMPDQTKIGLQSTNLFATYNARYATATWQAEFARALQTWAAVTPLNFHFVPDSGAAQGTPGLVQGNPSFGDIRLGGFTSPGAQLASAYYPYPTTTRGGDITLNDRYTFNIGSNYDLYTVLLHESGHALGLGHSTVAGSVLGPYITGVYTGLTADDVAGIRALYGARSADIFDAVASNATPATATLLPLNATAGATFRADLTNTTDVDTYKLTVPAGSNGTLTVTLDPSQISLLIPKLTLLSAAGQVVASASASTYGSAVSITLTGLTAGQTYFVQANGATSNAFRIGSYILNTQFGGFGVGPYTPPAGTSVTSTTSTGGSAGSANALPMPFEEWHDCDHHEVLDSAATHRNEHAAAQDPFGFWTDGPAATPPGLSLAGEDLVPQAARRGIETALDRAATPLADRLFHEIWSPKSKKTTRHDDDASSELGIDLGSAELVSSAGAEGGGGD